MLYLNGGFEGGNTRFIGGGGVEHEVSPKPGSVLVFTHDILHDGERLASGVKYIMRSDVMYTEE